MVVIDILQKVKKETEGLLGQLNSGSSRIYEISTTGTIVERTDQLRNFYEFVALQIEQVIALLHATSGRARD